jgi:chemotaxis protein methyltransferase CheR
MKRPEDFQRLLVWLKNDWGLTIQETQWISLARFLDEKLGSDLAFPDYQVLVKGNEEERSDLLEAATIGETYFFRDEAQFAMLRRWILPAFRSLHFRMPMLWSAACSTGEEALSLLLVLADAWEVGPEACRNKVWASDVNSRALKQFSSGLFRTASLREDGKGFHPLLEPFLTKSGSSFVLNSTLVDLIPKLPVNLITDSLASLPGSFDIIFLRNMMIYVSLEERPRIYEKIVAKLSPEGVLILGKAELPFFEEKSMDLAEIDGTFLFVKKKSLLSSWEKRGYGWPITN